MVPSGDAARAADKTRHCSRRSAEQTGGWGGGRERSWLEAGVPAEPRASWRDPCMLPPRPGTRRRRPLSPPPCDCGRRSQLGRGGRKQKQKTYRLKKS